jgi:hypothetical protein
MTEDDRRRALEQVLNATTDPVGRGVLKAVLAQPSLIEARAYLADGCKRGRKESRRACEMVLRLLNADSIQPFDVEEFSDGSH